ncbi:MAG: hypothetical protein R3202_12400 [Candidatus Competibacterales bacterium]|nr:hypothetical protein [Candidatus Competibacterales bacterium]
MKLILSRKGFDSGAGGGPSPILPDGTLLSLPIPSRDSRRYSEVRTPAGQTCAQVMRQLGIRTRGGCHVDPDLDPDALPRAPGWRAAFGSVGAAGRHLQLQGVGAGDLFLFFGWFRPTRLEQGRLRFEAGPDLHVIFGYLQVGDLLRVGPEARLPEWLADHPHAAPARRSSPGNTIYLAAPRLTLAGTGGPGAGLLPYARHRVLTAPDHSRSRWALPRRVFAGRPITYHSEKAWRDGVFHSARRGQEFVMETDAGLRNWIAGILSN